MANFVFYEKRRIPYFLNSPQVWITIMFTIARSVTVPILADIYAAECVTFTLH